MPDHTKNLMIIAGEVSGDLIGAGLIKELKKADPFINIYGIGGEKMQSAGMELNFHIRDMAFLGFTEVIKHLPFISKVREELIKTINERKISVAVLIDYPGFNLNMAKKIKLLGLKVIYYVSPQVWAWGSGRLKKIKKFVDKMIVLFPFEEKFYRENDIDVTFVGHPLMDAINEYQYMSKTGLFKKYSLDESKEILLLMPGSREQEIAKLFPAMIRSAEKICTDYNMQAVVACSQNINENIFNKLYSGNYKVANDSTYDLMKYSAAGIIKSGTSTLEAALFELPMVIVYKTSRLTYLIGKNLIKLKNIGLVNIIYGEKIIPELIQSDVTAEKIYAEMHSILSDRIKLNDVKMRLKEVKLKLGERGASARAAGLVYNELQKT